MEKQVCTRCGKSDVKVRCTHPAGHQWRDLNTRLGAKAKPLSKAVDKPKRDVEYFNHIAEAKKHMERAIDEINKARGYHDRWDLEFAQRGLRTQLYFLNTKAKL
jgi:hypothetical protein